MIESCVFTDEVAADFEEAVRICAELHVRYVEPRGLGGGVNINRIDRDGAAGMKRILDSYGVRVGVIGSSFGKCALDNEEEWEEHLAILERQIEFCELFGTRVIRGFAFWLPAREDWRRGPRPDIEERIERIVERLAVACSLAEEAGVTLALETEPSTFSGSCAEVGRILEAVGSPALSCCWDVANSWHFGVPAYPEAYRSIRGRVRHLHIKDLAIASEDPSRILGTTHIDLGDIPYHEIFRALIDDGYDGLASVETHLFFGMADRHRWLQPATVSALRNLNRVLAEVQGGF
jgi:sugar phosphate isomerase/epimerase